MSNVAFALPAISAWRRLLLALAGNRAHANPPLTRTEVAEPLRLDSLKLDPVLFGKDGGVVERRLATEAGPLRAAKARVKQFDLLDHSCSRLGSLLLNDLLACSSGGHGVPGCFERLALATRSPFPVGR